MGYEVTIRPAKSTRAIIDKLRRGTIHLSQVQDIAGCRIVVPDVSTQTSGINQFVSLFEATRVVDRVRKPSHGYRALHCIVKVASRNVEIQLRTLIQHRWAELSEKLSDIWGLEVKYGGGPPEIRRVLDELSTRSAELEELEARLAMFRSIQPAETIDHAVVVKDLDEQLAQIADERRNLIRLFTTVEQTFAKGPKEAR